MFKYHPLLFKVVDNQKWLVVKPNFLQNRRKTFLTQESPLVTLLLKKKSKKLPPFKQRGVALTFTQSILRRHQLTNAGPNPQNLPANNTLFRSERRSILPQWKPFWLLNRMTVKNKLLLIKRKFQLGWMRLNRKLKPTVVLLAARRLKLASRLPTLVPVANHNVLVLFRVKATQLFPPVAPLFFNPPFPFRPNHGSH